MIARSTNPRCRPVAALCALIAALACTVQCTAAPLLHVEVYDRASGRILDQYYHRGQRYVAGEPGHEYSIRVRNVSGGRVLAVVSVDGVNVITGETAAPDQSGYVIDPGQVVDVEGWRKSLERTAAFYFTDLGDAYATLTGRPSNVGVIGIAAFRERAYPAIAAEDRDEARVDAGAQPAPSKPTAELHGASDASASAGLSRQEAAPSIANSPLGTGHGRQEYSPARRVEFERSSDRPDQLVAVRYDGVERLVARGVITSPRPNWQNPDPFPGALGFVPDP